MAVVSTFDDVLGLGFLRIRMDRCRPSLGTGCRISRRCASTGVGTERYASQKGGWFRPVLQVAMCQLGSDRGVAAHALAGWLLLPQFGVTIADCTPVRLNFVGLSEARMHTMCLGCWRSYGFMRPVLKHGPRSLTCVRVLG